MAQFEPAYQTLVDRLIRIRQEGRPMGFMLEMISAAAAEDKLTGGALPRDALLEFVQANTWKIHVLIDADAPGGIEEGRKQLLALSGNIPPTRQGLTKAQIKNLVLLETSYGQLFPEMIAHRQERKARGLSEQAGSGKAEPAIVIRAAGSGQDLKIGQSRIGGMPDLPPGFQWPQFKGKKIPFVAQLNLSEFPEAAGTVLPDDGHLFAFALISNDADHWPPPMSVVLHLGSARALVRSSTPGANEIWPAWHDDQRNIRHQLIYDLVPAAPQSEASGKTKRSGKKIGWLLGKLKPGMGTPGELADQLFADGDDWINLLAIESVGSMQWSDFGQLHFVIRRSALANLDFSNVIGMACSS